MFMEKIDMADPQTRDDAQLEGRPRPKPLYKWFTTCPTDWFIVVVRGEDIRKVIHSVKGWYVDENFEFQPEDRFHRNSITPERHYLGREFVGIPKIQGIYQYKFAWNKYWRSEEAGRAKPVYEIQAHKAEYVYITPFEAQYPLKFEGIEVIAKNDEDEDEVYVGVGFELTVRLRMRRPRIALMRNYDWFGQVLTPTIQRGIKDFVGDKTYDELIRASREGVAESLVQYLMGTDNDPSRFRQDLLRNGGVELIEIAITDIIPNQEFEKSLSVLATKQRDAQGIIVIAEANKRAAELEGEGEASKIRSIAAADEERIEKTVLAIARAGNAAVQLEKYRNLRGSGIVTLVEAGAQTPVLVGADGKPIIA
jgi:regulator of protease activity HflC (stomatin/prohibitin superfamily)